MCTTVPRRGVQKRPLLQVLAMLEGRKDLPWEGELSTMRRKFGVFSWPVLQLLRRDQSRRSTLEAFHASCNHMFSRAATADVTQ